MLEKKSYNEIPQETLKEMKKIDADKKLKVQRSLTESKVLEHNYEPEIKKSNTGKMTTIKISYSTREKLDALKKDRESYESVIQRLLERPAAKTCCVARWM